MGSQSSAGAGDWWCLFWRWVFYINLVIGAVLVPAFLFCRPAIDPMPDVQMRKRLAFIDFSGFVLGGGVWVSFLMAFTMAGAQWPWKDWQTIAIFVVFGVVLLAYVLQQYFAVLITPSRRAFLGHLLRSRTQVLLHIVMAQARQPCLWWSAISPSASIYKALFIIAGVSLIAGGGPLMVFLDPMSSTGTIYGLTVIVAVGAGLSMVTGYTIATPTLGPEDTGAGLKMQNVSQIGGQVTALAVAGQIYQSEVIQNLSAALAGRGFSQGVIEGAKAGTQSTLFQTLDGELRERAIQAVTEAMQTTFVLVSVSGGVMLIVALRMKREKLFGEAVAVGAQKIVIEPSIRFPSFLFNLDGSRTPSISRRRQRHNISWR
ncbi:hypothetical protein BDW72DRAFT_195991 [Aspergillus terricola var. indicus]